jgi:Cu/Zn superoxide dismutase
MPRGRVTQAKVVGRLTLLLASLAVILLLSACREASRASQEETDEGNSTTFVRLELFPTDDSGVGGTANFTKAVAGTRVELELRGLSQPEEIYLAHVHPGYCEDKKHPDAPEGETAYHHGHEFSREEHGDAHVLKENGEATAEEIEYPLTPVESNARGEGSSTTVLEGVTLDKLLSGGPKYLNIHAVGSGDPPQLTCANLGEATQHTS